MVFFLKANERHNKIFKLIYSPRFKEYFKEISKELTHGHIKAIHR